MLQAFNDAAEEQNKMLEKAERIQYETRNNAIKL